MDLISRKTCLTGITLSTQCVKGMWLQTCITCITRLTLRALIGRNGRCPLTDITCIYNQRNARGKGCCSKRIYETARHVPGCAAFPDFQNPIFFFGEICVIIFYQTRDKPVQSDRNRYSAGTRYMPHFAKKLRFENLTNPEHQ